MNQDLHPSPKVLPESVAQFTLPSAHNWDSTELEPSKTRFINELKRVLIDTEASWIAIVENKVTFCRNSSELISSYISQNPLVDMFYADSQNLKPSHGSYLRTDFCSEKMRSQQYLGPVVFYKIELLSQVLTTKEIDSFFPAYSIALYASALTNTVGHLNEVLYQQNSPKDDFSQKEKKALKEVVSHFLDSHGGGIVDTVESNGLIHSRRKVFGNPLVSIVIPTRAIFSEINGIDRSLVIDAVRSIIERTAYSNYEIVLVADEVAEPKVLSELSEIAGPRLKVVSWNKPFNFSQKMNFGVLHASGDYVLLLNDDVEVISSDWMSEMLALAQLPNAGMVGAMLYYEDETIQHAGHAYFRGSPTHIGLGLPRGSSGPEGAFLMDRRVSGVTAACSLMPISVFMEVGGFTTLLPGNFNDVDLCQKVDWRGYEIYWTPRAELYHFESKTRDAHVHYYELDVIEHRWGLRLDDERFWRGKP